MFLYVGLFYARLQVKFYNDNLYTDLDARKIPFTEVINPSKSAYNVNLLNKNSREASLFFPSIVPILMNEDLSSVKVRGTPTKIKGCHFLCHRWLGSVAGWRDEGRGRMEGWRLAG